MSILSLKERMLEYQQAYDIKLLKKVPIIIEINGRSFSKLTSKIEKPFSSLFTDAMCATSLKLAHDVEGVNLIYSFNDEIILILKNDNADNTAWYDNKIQKIISCISSIASLTFYQMSKGSGLLLNSDPIFMSKAFVLPNIQEVTNYLIYKQQQCYYNSVSNSVYYELLKKYSHNTVESILYDRNLDSKIEILKQECNVDFMNYPLAFKRGIAIYRIQNLIKDENTNDVLKVKNKWTIDTQLPLFSKQHNFLQNILGE